MQPLQKAFLSAAKTCNQRDCFESVYINSRATVLTRGIIDPRTPLTLPVSKSSSQKTKTLVKTRPTPKTLPSAAAQGTVFKSRNKVFTLIPSLPFIGPTIQQSPNQTAKISPCQAAIFKLITGLRYHTLLCAGCIMISLIFYFPCPQYLGKLTLSMGQTLLRQAGHCATPPHLVILPRSETFWSVSLLYLGDTRQTEYNENAMTSYHFSVNRSLTFRPFIV